MAKEFEFSVPEFEEEYYSNRMRIMYKDENNKICEELIKNWKTVDIKKLKKKYKRFICYRYLPEYSLYEYQDYPWNRSGLLREFNKKYEYQGVPVDSILF